MGLSKYKLGDLIELVEIRNIDLKYGIDDVRGISIQKVFIDTKADMTDVLLTPYLVVKKASFAYVPTTSRNGEKITIAYNNTEETYIVSSSYIVFNVIPDSELLTDYLFVYFNRPEFDRYSRFHSWGSARESFSWETFCNIEIELPDLTTQQKYVDVYNALKENQKSYEQGLEDLKLTCDAYIERLRKDLPCEEIGGYIDQVLLSNTQKKVDLVLGVESSSNFMKTRAKMQGIDTSNYTIVNRNDIAYNPSRINLGSIALYKKQKPCIVSPMYQVFNISKKDKLVPEYLMLWLGRTEFFRYAWFYASGSVRDTFDFELMKQVRIPIPELSVQQAIVDIYNAYQMRKDINKKLKQQLKDICPILIRGSLSEGER